MKRIFLFPLILLIGLSLSTIAFGADKDAIKAQVDEIVVAIDGGKKAEDFADAAKKEPHYVFIMQEDGAMLVHPSLVGTNLKDRSEALYGTLSQATAEGVWVKYEWDGKEKNTYVRKTAGGLIVGSGY